MPRAASGDPIYYTPEVIELCVRWYLTHHLSYRDLSAMMTERDIVVSHTIIPALGAALRAGVRAPLAVIRKAD